MALITKVGAFGLKVERTEKTMGAMAPLTVIIGHGFVQ